MTECAVRRSLCAAAAEEAELEHSPRVVRMKHHGPCRAARQPSERRLESIEKERACLLLIRLW
jgi:hypothetical protein